MAASEPSRRHWLRNLSRQALRDWAGAGGGGCSSSPLPKGRRWDFGARAIALAVLVRAVV